MRACRIAIEAHCYRSALEALLELRKITVRMRIILVAEDHEDSPFDPLMADAELSVHAVHFLVLDGPVGDVVGRVAEVVRIDQHIVEGKHDEVGMYLGEG